MAGGLVRTEPFFLVGIAANANANVLFSLNIVAGSARASVIIRKHI